MSQKEVPPTFEKSFKQIQTNYGLNIYMARKRIMFLVYCEKMRLFENPNFKIWAIEHYYPKNLPLHETGFL